MQPWLVARSLHNWIVQNLSISWIIVVFWASLIFCYVISGHASAHSCTDGSDNLCSWRQTCIRVSGGFLSTAAVLVCLTWHNSSMVRSVLTLSAPSGSRAALVVWVPLATLTVIVLVFAPSSAVEMYALIIMPVLGMVWLVFQGYVVLKLVMDVHRRCTSPLRQLAAEAGQTVQTRLLNKLTTPLVGVSRHYTLLTCCYAVVFIMALATSLALLWNELVQSTISATLMLIVTFLGCIWTYYSARWVVNRGILVPAIMLLYCTTLMISLAAVDPGNWHNTTFTTALSMPDSSTTLGSNVVEMSGETSNLAAVGKFVRHSALLEATMLANNVRLWIFYAMAAGYCLTKYDMGGFLEFKHEVGNMVRLLRKMSQQLCNKYTSKEAGVEPDKFTLLTKPRGDSATQSRAEQQLLEDGNGTATQLQLAEEGSLLEFRGSGQELDPRNADLTTSTIFGSSNGSSNRPLVEHLPAHYFRMALLINYTALLLIHWEPGNGAHWATASDLPMMSSTARAAAEALLPRQYFFMGLQVASLLVVCLMYTCSMYGAYRVNRVYRQAREQLFVQEFGSSRTAEAKEIVGAGVMTVDSYVDKDLGVRYS